MPRSPDRMRPAPLPLSAATAAATMIVCLCCCLGQHDCPPARHVSPCACTERDQGLDVTCSDVTSVQLREVLDVVGLGRQKIWFLRIRRVDLNSLSRSLLQGLDVKNLMLVQSNVSVLDSNAFSGDPSRMESLDLERNALDKVPTRSLSVLKSLAALSLDRNQIEVLEAHSFSGLESLLWLSLYGNRIRLIDSRAFLGTESSLTRLNLGGNRLGQVPRYALQRLHCLQGLRMQNNSISEITVEQLPASLCDLDLSGNEIVALDRDSLLTLGQLNALDLEDNKIGTLHDEAFNGLHDSLEWLKLGGNRLTSIPSHSLRNLTRLRQLDLRSNQISRIEAGAFRRFGRTLKFIFLQKNRIQTIDEGAFDTLESAQWLYVHSNHLTMIHYDTFRPVIGNLHVLDLHDNPYSCSCEVLWFRDWLAAEGQNVANLPRETRCNTPEEHALKPIVKLNSSHFACSGTSRMDHLLLVLLSALFVFFHL